jgi:hypothetical protein
MVKLSADERARLDSVIHSGKHPAQRLMKARILLKADAGEAGEAWSNSQIAKALESSLATIVIRRGKRTPFWSAPLRVDSLSS